MVIVSAFLKQALPSGEVLADAPVSTKSGNYTLNYNTAVKAGTMQRNVSAVEGCS